MLRALAAREGIIRLPAAASTQPSSFHKAHLSREGGLLICSSTRGRLGKGIHRSRNMPAARQTLCPEDPQTSVPFTAGDTGHVHTSFLSGPFSTYSSACRAGDACFLILRPQRHHCKLRACRGPKARRLPARTVPAACFCGDEITELTFCVWSYMGFKGCLR